MPGTEHLIAPDARPLGAADPAETVEASVFLRPPPGAESLEDRLARGAPPLTREEYAAQYGAVPSDIAAVEKFARAHGLEIVQSDAARRTVVLRGTVAQMNDAFGVSLQRFQAHDGSTFRSHSGPQYVPPELAGIVQAVLGLDTRPVAHRR